MVGCAFAHFLDFQLTLVVLNGLFPGLYFLSKFFSEPLVHEPLLEKRELIVELLAHRFSLLAPAHQIVHSDVILRKGFLDVVGCLVDAVEHILEQIELLVLFSYRGGNRLARIEQPQFLYHNFLRLLRRVAHFFEVVEDLAQSRLSLLDSDFNQAVQDDVFENVSSLNSG